MIPKGADALLAACWRGDIDSECDDAGVPMFHKVRASLRDEQRNPRVGVRSRGADLARHRVAGWDKLWT